MKRIRPSDNPQRWPNRKVESVECRKRDLVIRIANWTRDQDEPAYDVEVYIGGVYSYLDSAVLSQNSEARKYGAKFAAILHAQQKIAELL